MATKKKADNVADAGTGDAILVSPGGGGDAEPVVPAGDATTDQGISVSGESGGTGEAQQTESQPATKKRKVAKLPLDEFPVQIRMPAEDGADETIITVGIGLTYAIARYVAYTIAARGVPSRWLKMRDSAEDPLVWHTIAPDDIQGKHAAHISMVINEAKADRAIYVAAEMRSRARIGNIQGELAAMARDASNPQFRLAIREAMGSLADSMALPIVPTDMLSYGIDWVDAYDEHIASAQQAWGVDPEVCPGCGEVHDEDGFAEALLGDIAPMSYDFNDDVPVA